METLNQKGPLHDLCFEMFSDFVEGKGTNDRHREESTKLNVYTTYTQKKDESIYLQHANTPEFLFSFSRVEKTNKQTKL